MKFGHKAGLVAALLFTQYLWGVRFADANVMYTYLGNDFTSFGSIGTITSGTAYTASDMVTGEFTLATPLADNLSGYSFTPLSYSFSDGVDTLNSTNSEIFASNPAYTPSTLTTFVVSTNGSGDITAWTIQLQGDLSNNSNDSIFTTTGLNPIVNDGNAEDWGANGSPGVYFGYNSNSPGTFSFSQTPLPAALPLFAGGLGLMGLFGCRRKRKNTAAIAAA
jgi:hypothetical protein